MPWVTQNEGKIVLAQRRASPIGIVFGKICRTNVTIVNRPPATKWMNSVQIYAVMSDLKRKEVTYV